MKYISKCIYERTLGCNVRLPVIENSQIVSKKSVSHFVKRSDFRSWKACMDKAVKYRDAYLKKNNALYLITTNQIGHFGKGAINTGRNTSGAIGITLTADVKAGGVHYGYRGTWCETVDGERIQKHRQFSFGIYGEEDAFKLACRARYKHLGKIVIKNKQAIPCLPDVPYEIRL